MSNKSIILLLLSAMLSSTFISCAGSADMENPSMNLISTVTELTEISAMTETDYFKTFENYDFKSENFKIIAQSVKGAQPVIPDDEPSGEIVSDALYQRDKTIEETFNVQIDYTKDYNTVDSRTQLTADLKKSVFAGDAQWNFIVNSLANGLNSSTTDGILMDLMSIPKLKLDQPWWSNNMYKNFSYKGKLFVTTGSLTLAYYYAPCVLAYNQKLAKNYGITNIYETVIDGKWTLERFAELTKNIGKDIDGNGKMTESDFYALACDELSAASFFIGSGGRHDEIGNDGNPIFVLGSESNVSKINKVASILKDKKNVIRTDDLKGNNYTEKKTKTFKNSQSLFLAYNMAGLIDCLRDMNDDYSIIPVPKWNEQQDTYYSYGSPFGAIGIAVPITNKNTEHTGVIMESMAYLSHTNVGPLMFEVTLKEKVARDENSKYMLDLIYQDIMFDWTTVFSIGNLHILVRDVCIGKKDNFVSEYEKIKPKVDSALNDILNAYDTYIS